MTDHRDLYKLVLVGDTVVVGIFLFWMPLVWFGYHRQARLRNTYYNSDEDSERDYFVAAVTTGSGRDMASSEWSMSLKLTNNSSLKKIPCVMKSKFTDFYFFLVIFSFG